MALIHGTLHGSPGQAGHVFTDRSNHNRVVITQTFENSIDNLSDRF